jgi:hypothetical protein
MQAFCDLFHVMDNGALAGKFSQELKSRMAVTAFQVCHRTVLEQDTNGSWQDSPEKTAYGILILSSSQRLSFLGSIGQKAQEAIDIGLSFLSSLDILSLPPDYIWIEKVTYASSFLALSYILAAKKTATYRPASTHLGFSLNVSTSLSSGNDDFVGLFCQTPLFCDVPKWQVQASRTESILFQPLLWRHRLDIFPRDNMAEDKYFDMIPFTWTACNNRSRTFASSSLLLEMMIISFLNYQVDEFMEAVAAPAFANTPRRLRELIQELVFGSKSDDTFPRYDDKVARPLAKFVSYILRHPCVVSASPWNRMSLQRELRVFLVAHAQQAEDSAQFTLQSYKGTFHHSQSSFFQWVRTTAADHTSCPYSFSFLGCLLSSSTKRGHDCFPTTSLKYFAEAACRHLASMCRIYNDYGSVSRDSIEGNLNSINFPEFEVLGLNDSELATDTKIQSQKDILFILAEYERSGLNEALTRLDDEFEVHGQNINFRRIGKRHMDIWRMFCNVTDLYGQIYYIRDMASRMKSSSWTQGTNATGGAIWGKGGDSFQEAC